MLLGSSDEQLVDLVLDGDDEAFEVLFDRHVADAIWFARDVLGSWGDAEEAVRHSFAAAHAYLASRDREIDFAPWLHTILSNHCLSMLQARGPQPDELARVVDLDEWRRQRKRLGVAAPAVGMGLRDSVMTACGIGTGSAAAGAPLLGGTVAKLAVVAVLAGGAGAVGQAAPEQDRPARGEVAQVDRGGAAATPSSVGDDGSARADLPNRAADPAPGGRRAVPVGARPPPPSDTEDPAAGPPAEAPSAPAPDAPASTTGGSPPAAPSADLPAKTVDAPTAPDSPLRTTLRRVTDVVKAPTPADAPPASCTSAGRRPAGDQR